METFSWAWDLTAPSCTDFPEIMAHNSIISMLPIFAHHPPEHLTFTQGPLQASAPAGLTFHASCTQGNAAPACRACAVFPDEAQQGEKPAGRPGRPGCSQTPLGFTCDDSSPCSSILEPNWTPPGPPVIWG